MTLIPVIMAGGNGERFWPLSRINNPKQCLKITSNKTMIQETIDSLKPLSKNIFISTRQDLKNKIKKTINAQFILEPERRDTAAAIGLACIEVMKKHNDPVIFIETADHFYKDKVNYRKHIKLAYKEAKKNSIILIGIKPTFPNTGYGYIQPKNNNKISEIKSFKEKPNEKKAKLFVKNNYLWNSGMFVFKASVMLEEIKKYMPKLYKGLLEIKKSSKNKAKIFKTLDKISIDFGIIEKSKKTKVLKGTFPWEDVGSWKSMENIHKADKNNNILLGKATTLNSKNNITINKKLVALCDVNNLIIIESKDAILVCKKDSCQDVKKLVKNLKKDYL